MKGQAAANRRWRCLAATGAALALLFFAVVVPLAVLLGLHTRFPSVYLGDESAVSVYGGTEGGSWEPNPSEDWTNTNASHTDTEHNGINSHPKLDNLNSNTSIYPGPPIQQTVTLENSSLLNITDTDLKDSFEQGLPGDESVKSCQLEFGSYCLWSVEHKEVMKDSIVKRLKDQLFVARTYYPSIAKLEGMEKLSREMKQNIQEHEHMLSEAISDADLPKLVASLRNQKFIPHGNLGIPIVHSGCKILLHIKCNK